MHLISDKFNNIEISRSACVAARIIYFQCQMILFTCIDEKKNCLIRNTLVKRKVKTCAR